MLQSDILHLSCLRCFPIEIRRERKVWCSPELLNLVIQHFHPRLAPVGFGRATQRPHPEASASSGAHCQSSASAGRRVQRWRERHEPCLIAPVNTNSKVQSHVLAATIAVNGLAAGVWAARRATLVPPAGNARATAQPAASLAHACMRTWLFPKLWRDHATFPRPHLSRLVLRTLYARVCRAASRRPQAHHLAT